MTIKSPLKNQEKTHRRHQIT